MGPGLILLETLLVLMGPFLVQGLGSRMKPPAPHFLFQSKVECHFANGTAGEVRFLYRLFYGRQEFLRYDSHRGVYQALTPLGAPEAAHFNGQKERMDGARAEVDTFCRHNYPVLEAGWVVGRTVEPTVKISPTKAGPLAHQTLLICTTAGYYPSEVTIKWLKNGQEQMEGLGYADEIQNGDWTFQNQVMLETEPEWGDVYACQVEHSSLKEPITVLWEPETSDSAKSKVWTGAMAAVLGAVFVAVGLYLYLKSRKATPLTPPTALIS